MGVRLRLSRQTLSVLDALLVRAVHWHHGYAISKQTGIASGTLYPILMRLEKLGWLETRWEEIKVHGRPPRHQYRLSANGHEWAAEELRAAQRSDFWKRKAGEEHE